MTVVSRIVRQGVVAARTLQPSGRCVVWGGVRVWDATHKGFGSDGADGRWSNAQLERLDRVSLAAVGPLRPCPATQGRPAPSDGLDPMTATGRATLARAAVRYARASCDLR